MLTPLLSALKLIAVFSIVVLLKSCSNSAGLAGGSGKASKQNKGAQSGPGSEHDTNGKGGGPDNDTDLSGSGKGLQKGIDTDSGEFGAVGSGGGGAPKGSGKPKNNDNLINFDPQFKSLSNEQFVVSSESVKKPLDLIIAVDTSGSMGEEAMKVQQNVSVLTQSFAKEKNLDYHIWIIAQNVMPAGVDPAKVSIVNQDVGSNNALGILSETITGVIPLPTPFRKDTQKAFVVVTDDNAENVTSAAFISTIQADPRFKDKTSVNGLIWIEGVSRQSATCEGAAPGTEYITLAKAKETSGMVYDLCANDWNPLFVDLGKRLVQQSVILEYKLKSSADPKGPFVVGVNGTKLDPATFRYDEAKNAIIFADGKAPPVGAAVVVGFKPR